MSYTEAQASQPLDQFTFGYTQVAIADHVMTLTLNRPAKKNAMNPRMMAEIAFALAHARYNADVWAVVVAAQGDVFCAGADLKAFAGAAGADEPASTIPDAEGEILLGEAFLQAHKPCIARVHGNVYAGGFLITCGCQYVIAAEGVTFSLPEVKRGIFPMQVMASLMQVMSPRLALDFCVRGRTVNATEAQALGLATRTVPVTELDSAVSQLVETMKENSPSAIRMGLQAFDELRAIPHHQQHAYLKGMLAQTLQTQDAKEGIAAFMEKRKPNWTGQ